MIEVVDRIQGIVATRAVRARALSVLDSRMVVRAHFLASAVELELLKNWTRPAEIDEIAGRLNATQHDRLKAWLAVGVEARELKLRNGRYRPSGLRAKAIAAGDVTLTAQYRSLFEYQSDAYRDLGRLLYSPQGRDDLSRAAETIATVSRAAEPFVQPIVRRCASAPNVRRILDVGSGSGIYLRHLAEAQPAAVVEGIELDGVVVAKTNERLASWGLSERASLTAGDVLEHRSDKPYDLITLLNNVYYFGQSDRSTLFAHLRGMLAPGGRLLVVTMTVPGSIAAAHLDLLLSAQTGNAALPNRDQLVSQITAAGFDTPKVSRLVPSEPFFAFDSTLA